MESVVRTLSATDRKKEHEVRPGLLDAVARYGQSRYEFGAALSRYKAVFKRDRIWLRVCKIIGKQIGRSERTVFRVLADYERVLGAPEAVLAAMEQAGFDPTQPKNTDLLAHVTEMMPSEPTTEEAAEIVRRGAAHVRGRKCKFNIPEDERVVWALRHELRKQLNNIPNERKPKLLERAISEEAYSVWGVDVPFFLEITPRRGPMTVDGRWIQSEAGVA